MKSVTAGSSHLGRRLVSGRSFQGPLKIEGGNGNDLSMFENDNDSIHHSDIGLLDLKKLSQELRQIKQTNATLLNKITKLQEEKDGETKRTRSRLERLENEKK